VQLGKKLATQMIDVYIDKRTKKKVSYDLGEAFLNL
jgi:hypothetical protein